MGFIARKAGVMDSSPAPTIPGPQRKVSALRAAARECWALACWLTLRRTWAMWEQERAGDETKRGPLGSLPAPVEAFFGNYAHAAYCKWIPIVAKETMTRKERDRIKRANKKKAAQEEFEKLRKGDATPGADEPSDLTGASLESNEEIYGALAAEFGLGSGVEDKSASASTASHEAWTAAYGDLKLAFHNLHIEEPSRPQDAEDKTPWGAWQETWTTLWVPLPKSRRVLMNELFKQPAGKPSSTANEMLSCLTGYLKTIVREAVRRAAQDAVRTKDGSDESVAGLDAPASAANLSDGFTGMDVIPSSADTELSVIAAELRNWADQVARAELEANHPKENSEGVRLCYYLDSLKKKKESKHGLVVSVYHTAILSQLNIIKSTLYDHVKKSRIRLAKEAIKHARVIDADPALLTQWLGRRVKEAASEWFWSEKIDRDLFGTVMHIIHTEHDSHFQCPGAAACGANKPADACQPRCWACPRK